MSDHIENEGGKGKTIFFIFLFFFLFFVTWISVYNMNFQLEF